MIERDVLLAQPAFTASLLGLQAVLGLADVVAPATPSLLSIALGIPVLLLSTLCYLYTVPFVALLLSEARSLDVVAAPASALAATVAVVAQAGYLVWPVYRVLGPGTFEELLFAPADLVVLVVASLGTLGYRYLGDGADENVRTA
ncbi:hypothetical protein [Halarchaeum sp. P4]|uniref:hypothetical protein n=1 Tax=Halarchaeum sp. P4 TaxID=3421639 RepID=UPI003EBFD4E8